MSVPPSRLSRTFSGGAPAASHHGSPDDKMRISDHSSGNGVLFSNNGDSVRSTNNGGVSRERLTSAKCQT